MLVICIVERLVVMAMVMAIYIHIYSAKHCFHCSHCLYCLYYSNCFTLLKQKHVCLCRRLNAIGIGCGASEQTVGVDGVDGLDTP